MPPPRDQLSGPDLGLRGKAAAVTGAGAGLGRATAIALAERGARVLVSDVDLGSAEETARLVRARGGEAAAMRVDVSREPEVGAMIARAEGSFGPLFCLVNNAAVAQALAPDADRAELLRLCYDDRELERVWSVNVHGVRHGMKHALAVMRPRRSGVILNVASNTAIRPWLGLPMYSASKAAIVGLTRTVARRMAPEGLRINALCPGGMPTALLSGSSGGAAGLERLAAGIPARRLATPEEIGRTAAWMCDRDAAFMIGEALVIDGGATSW